MMRINDDVLLLQAGAQSEIIQDLENKLSEKNKLMRELDLKKTELNKKILEVSNCYSEFVVCIH